MTLSNRTVAGDLSCMGVTLSGRIVGVGVWDLSKDTGTWACPLRPGPAVKLQQAIACYKISFAVL